MRKPRPAVRFATAGLIILVVWGIVLPRLSRLDTIQKRHDWLQRNKIDPAAIYYTDLPLMEDLASRHR